MRVLAAAKLNLHLRVGKKRADGFHPIVSWMCTIGLFDTLIFERARQNGFALSCEEASVPRDQGNLVMRAAAVLAGDLPGGVLGSPAGVGDIQAELHKRIPVGAGLGGGSSDAARTLLALNHLWTTGYGKEETTRLAAALGSDVPFFLNGPSAVCTGRGEIVHPIAPPKPKWALLFFPDFSLATADVYRRFDELHLGYDATPQEDWFTRSNLPAELLLPALVNDLEPPAFSLRPELQVLRNNLEQQLQRPVRMSGSGSTLFTLYDDAPDISHLRGRVSLVPLCPKISDDLDL